MFGYIHIKSGGKPADMNPDLEELLKWLWNVSLLALCIFLMLLMVFCGMVSCVTG